MTESPAPPVRVLIVDDDPLVLIALRGLLRADPALEIAASVENGSAVLPAVRRHRPDVVLLDVRMKGVSGPEVLGPLRRAVPGVRVVVMSSFIGEEARAAVLNAGADAFVPKVAPPERFSAEIRRVAGLGAASSGVPLTDRERDVARGVADGQSTRAIARALGLTESTTRTYVSRLLDKTGATSRVELANRVVAGVVDVSPRSERAGSESTGPRERGTRPL